MVIEQLNITIKIMQIYACSYIYYICYFDYDGISMLVLEYVIYDTNTIIETYSL